MRLVKGEYTVSLDNREAKEIAYAIHRSLIISIKEHYNRLQQNKDGEAVFFELNVVALGILRLMYSIIGDDAENRIREYKGMFKIKRNERILREKGLAEK